MPKPELVRVPTSLRECSCCKGKGTVMGYLIETRGAWTERELREQREAAARQAQERVEHRAEMERMFREGDASNPDRCDGCDGEFGTITICVGCGDPQEDCSCGSQTDEEVEG